MAKTKLKIPVAFRMLNKKLPMKISNFLSKRDSAVYSRIGNILWIPVHTQTRTQRVHHWCQTVSTHLFTSVLVISLTNKSSLLHFYAYYVCKFCYK